MENGAVQRINGSLLYSPSDLNAYLDCEHLTTLDLAVARGEVGRPAADNPHADLIRRKGEEHEARYLAQLRLNGRNVVEIPFDGDFDASATATREAMRAGADVVYQGCFVYGGWRGFADFLERVERPSDLGPWSYEAVDTKLARQPKPYYVLQLCFYSGEIARVQRIEPERVHVVLGSGERVSLRPADFSAYYRRVRHRFLAFVASGRETYPWPVEHCSLCEFKSVCDERWDRDDHLVRVANIRRDQIVRLQEEGLMTLEALALTAPDTVVPRLAPATFEKLRDQAALQHRRRITGELAYHLLPPEQERGLGLLPEPATGDLFFDIEGDPFWAAERGLEYLFGFLWSEDGGTVFRPFWGHHRDEEKRAFEQTVDLIHERLARDPTMHVYHYAHYEPTALKRLAAEYGTREEQLDNLLRREVFVDLYAVVRQGLRASVGRYSIKDLEAFYLDGRAAPLGSGDEAVLAYEEWKGTRNEQLLEAIAAYNEEDCRSTLELRDWLLRLRQEAGVATCREPPAVRTPAPEQEELREERERVAVQLFARGEELAAQLIDYHKREAKPGWWAFFSRLERTSEELVDDSEAIGELDHVTADALPRPSRSVAHTFRFPAQEHKLGPGDQVVDPYTGEDAGMILDLDDAQGILVLQRGPKLKDVPLPCALIPTGPWPDSAQRDAVLRFARSLLAGDHGYPALESVLRREAFDRRVQTSDLEEMRLLVASLNGRHLFVQGPPGSGKTWTGAQLIAHLLTLGKRVGVTAPSHKAIHNLLEEIEATGADFVGLKKSSGGGETVYEGEHIKSVDAIQPFLDPEVRLLAGTAWLFAREELDRTVDYLFVDEAGQVSLADALAVGTAARNIVLLGDPLQLGQVTQGIHPSESGRSVLEHLLDDAQTIPEDRGLFLERSRRMHPDVCRFVSEAFYEGRLESIPECAGQTTGAGTGLRFIAVEHEGNRSSSPEEAARIRLEIDRLTGLPYTDWRGETRPLHLDDFMVVAPYNSQVRCLREALPRGVPVGTVDKFQGQEAAVVFFSMATSSGEDVPRNIEFLLSRNRLNVAISRARCLAYIVVSPRLVEINCRSIEQMRMANALCLAVELASGSDNAAA